MIDRAWLDIDIFCGLETNDIVSSAGHTLEVDQVFDADVIGGDVAATSAATKTLCCIEMVINATKTAN